MRPISPPDSESVGFRWGAREAHNGSRIPLRVLLRAATSRLPLSPPGGGGGECGVVWGSLLSVGASG
jgi:hypothetical protein